MSGHPPQRQKPLDVALALLLGALIAVILMQVFFRYVLGNALGWAEELSIFLFVWLVFLGAAAASRDRMHITVTALIDRLPPRARGVALATSEVLQALFLGAGAWFGFAMARLMLGARSPALNLPVSLQYAALPASFLLALAYLGWRAVQRFRARSRERAQ